jgi:hypothetical protein
MLTITLSDILDDIQTAEEGLRKFERRYWVSSEVAAQVCGGIVNYDKGGFCHA